MIRQQLCRQHRFRIGNRLHGARHITIDFTVAVIWQADPFGLRGKQNTFPVLCCVNYHPFGRHVCIVEQKNRQAADRLDQQVSGID